MLENIKYLTNESPFSELDKAHTLVEEYMTDNHPKATEVDFNIFNGLYKFLERHNLHIPADLARAWINQWIKLSVMP